MAEYICRDDIISRIRLEGIYVSGYSDQEREDNVVDMIESTPAADARPVARGRWVYTDMSRLVCSNCGNPVAFALKDDGWHHGDYCPNCGARMEES